VKKSDQRKLLFRLRLAQPDKATTSGKPVAALKNLIKLNCVVLQILSIKVFVFQKVLMPVEPILSAE
jgi:hypothetical protein